MDFDFASIGLTTISSATMGAGGFWWFTKYRQDRMENELKKVQDQAQDVRERLIRIETILLKRDRNDER